MELKLTESPEEVAHLFGFKDDIENYIDGEHGDWITWLVQQKERKNDKVFIWIAYEDDEVVGYMVVFDNRLLPVMNNLFIFYASSNLSFHLNKKAMTEIADWAKSLNVTEITAVTQNPEMLEKYGFKKEPYMSMKLEL